MDAHVADDLLRHAVAALGEQQAREVEAEAALGGPVEPKDLRVHTIKRARFSSSIRLKGEPHRATLGGPVEPKAPACTHA